MYPVNVVYLMEVNRQLIRKVKILHLKRRQHAEWIMTSRLKKHKNYRNSKVKISMRCFIRGDVVLYEIRLKDKVSQQLIVDFYNDGKPVDLYAKHQGS
ncbi:hypothetical protein C1634_025540 [Chryseobacterium viscerum]|uniref:Uncharacterized protein n=1 Tax=Chryseobacterium viscerum TaxID=1037377 RepID=A0A316W9D7_9FLAO|nr:hypothetical protein C1634_025540 [Chryseobacterium viscerum]